ncbi:MAG: hypothetical protein AB7O43_18295 [Hyphomicrobiaceae bacterium]
MRLGTSNFETYNRVLRRVMWAEFIDEQLKVARESHFRASLVDEALPERKSILACIDQIRREKR